MRSVRTVVLFGLSFAASVFVGCNGGPTGVVIGHLMGILDGSIGDGSTGTGATTFPGFIDVTAAPYSARGDGLVDDTAALNSAFQAAESKGDKVIIPAGVYLVTASLYVRGIVVEGVDKFDYGKKLKSNDVTGQGSVIKIRNLGGLKVYAGSTVRKLSFWYPDQHATSTTPVVYPPTIDFQELEGDPSVVGNGHPSGINVENCTFMNSYTAIDAMTAEGKTLADSRFVGNRIYPLRWGIRLGTSYNFIYVLNNTFSPEFWQASINQPIREYTAKNSVAIEVGYADATYIRGNSTIGLKAAVQVVGTVTMLHVEGNTFDGTCLGLTAAEPRPNTTDVVQINGAIIANNHFNAVSWKDPSNVNCRGINLASSGPGHRATIVGNRFGGSHGYHLLVKDKSPGVNQWSRLNISSNFFENLGRDDQSSTSWTSIHIESPNTVINIQGNQFDDYRSDVAAHNNIATKVVSAKHLSFSGNITRNLKSALTIMSDGLGTGIVSGNAAIQSTGTSFVNNSAAVITAGLNQW